MKHLDCIVYTNAIFEEEKALCINGEVTVVGDVYHDKIDSVIEGFFYGLNHVIANKDAQYSYTKTEKTIGVDDVVSHACDFIMRIMVKRNEVATHFTCPYYKMRY